MNTVERNTEKRKFMKRILAVLVAAGLVVGMMPATAQAAGHGHYICGDASCSHTNKHAYAELGRVLSVTGDGALTIGGTAADVDADDDAYVLPKGGYYLNGDLSGLNKPILIKSAVEVSLCLNGCTITKMTEGDVILVKGELLLTDCQQNPGTITHGSADGAKYTGCGVHVKGGTFSMYGGKIDGNVIEANYGGGVLVEEGGEFNMYGGEISNNRTSYSGGGVAVVESGFCMGGGSITGNTAPGDNGYGGGVYVNNSGYNCFYMSGGNITNNTAARNGGGVFCMGGAAMYLSGSSVISGNKLTSNADSNLRLDSNTQTKLIISGTLKTGADIHMMWSDDVASEIAWGVATSDMSGYFTCDDPTYEAYYDADAENIKWKLKATPKVDPTYTAPVGKTGLTYTGSAQALIEAGTTNGGVMQYKLGDDGTYSTAIPTATAADAYTVYYRIVGDDSYNDVAEQPLFVEIARTTPAGTPTYTPITEAGRTLADANLTAPAGWPKGTLCWRNGDEDMDLTTKVTQGTSYHWVFTPNDVANYAPTESDIVLWVDGGSNPGHEHVWGAWVSNNDGKTHTRTCTTDSSHTETVNCSGGTATCTSLAVCSGCNTAYGSVNASNHAGGTEVRNYVAATTEATGYTGDTYCLGCHNIIAAGTTIPKLGSGSSSGTPSTGGSSTAPASTGSSDTTTSAGGSEEQAPVYESYTVQKGDTLRAIAKKYGCTVDEIVEANSELIKNPNLILVGWELQIPQKGETGTDNTSGEASQDNTNTDVYIVKKGDTLWGISRKCGCKVADIVALNRDLIADPNKIFAGWELKVPEE